MPYWRPPTSFLLLLLSICANWRKSVFKEHTDICLYAECPSIENPHSFRTKSIPPCLWISSSKNPLGVGNPKSHPWYRYGYFLASPIEKWRILTCILNLIAILKYFLWCYADISEEVFFIKFYQFVMKHNDSQSTFTPEDKRLAILLLNVSWLTSDSVHTHTAFRPSFKAATPAYPVELPISTTVSPSLER